MARELLHEGSVVRQREIVHYQRFGEALGMVRDKLDRRNYYAYNPAFRNR